MGEGPLPRNARPGHTTLAERAYSAIGCGYGEWEILYSLSPVNRHGAWRTRRDVWVYNFIAHRRRHSNQTPINWVDEEKGKGRLHTDGMVPHGFAEDCRMGARIWKTRSIKDYTHTYVHQLLCSAVADRIRKRWEHGICSQQVDDTLENADKSSKVCSL